MDETQKKYLYGGLVLLLIIFGAAFAAHYAGHGNNTTTTSPTTTAPTTSITTSETTTTTTSTESTTTSTTTSQTQTTTEYVTTSIETVTTTVENEITYTYVVPENYGTPVTGNFEENIIAYGISVPKTTYSRAAIVEYDGQNIYLNLADGGKLTIMPVLISGVPTAAEITGEHGYATLHLDMLYFIRDAFKSPTFGAFTAAESCVMAPYTTIIDGANAIGQYCYSNNEVILTITFPYTYTMNGVVFEITGAYTLTYTSINGTATGITETTVVTTTSEITHTETVTSTING